MSQRIKTKMAVLAMFLLIACLQAQAQSRGKTVKNVRLTVAEKEVRKQQKEKEKRLEIMSYYGLSNSQYEEYQRIQKIKKNKIEAVRKMNLSKEIRRARIVPIANENKVLLKHFFTPAQYALYEVRAKKLKEQKGKENTCIRAYKKERKALSFLPKSERRKAIEALNDKYIREMSMFMSPEESRKKILNIDYFRLANNKAVKKLKLSEKQIIALGKVFEKRDNRWKRINSKALSRADRKKRIQTLKDWERERYSKIMGTKKYAVYATYQNGTHERRYKKHLGFTDADYSAYKRVENNLAIEVLAIKRSKMQQAEKKQKIVLAKEKKVAALREVLPANTFEKWYKLYQDKMSKSAKKNI